MKTEGLRLASGRFEENSKLVEAIEKLPEGSVVGLSEYEPYSVIYRAKKVLIERPLNGTPLVINFPKGSKNMVASKNIISFTYKGTTYEICQ